MNDLGFEQAVDRLGQGIVVRCAVCRDLAGAKIAKPGDTAVAGPKGYFESLAPISTSKRLHDVRKTVKLGCAVKQPGHDEARIIADTTSASGGLARFLPVYV